MCRPRHRRASHIARIDKSERLMSRVAGTMIRAARGPIQEPETGSDPKSSRVLEVRPQVLMSPSEKNYFGQEDSSLMRDHGRSYACDLRREHASRDSPGELAGLIARR